MVGSPSSQTGQGNGIVTIINTSKLGRPIGSKEFKNHMRGVQTRNSDTVASGYPIYIAHGVWSRFSLDTPRPKE